MVEQNGHPVEITRARAQTYTAELIAEGKEPNTVPLSTSADHPRYRAT